MPAYFADVAWNYHFISFHIYFADQRIINITKQTKIANSNKLMLNI